MGYTFEGWYVDEAGTEEFTFGSPLTANTTVHAKWAPAENSYTVIVWKQRASDKVDALGEDKYEDWLTAYKAANPGATEEQTAAAWDAVRKHYDYDSSAVIDTKANGEKVMTGDYIILDPSYTTIYGADGTSSGKDKSFFYYNQEETTQYVVVKASGGSVFNVYYDRVPITMNFYTWGSGYYYAETTGDTEPQYGVVNGEHVLLSHVDDEAAYYTYTYRPAYQEVGNYTSANYTRYGIINGAYEPLTPVTEYTYSYNPFVPAQNDNGVQYTLVDGEYVQLRKVATSEYYGLTNQLTAGNDYLIVSRNGQGTGYALGHSGGNVATDQVTINGADAAHNNAVYINGTDWTNYQYEAAADFGTPRYGVDDRGGRVALDRQSAQTVYYFNGESYDGVKYYAPNNNPVDYSGTLYTMPNGVPHVTTEGAATGLHGLDPNGVYRELTGTPHTRQLWKYTDPETGELKDYTGTRYTRSTSEQASWQLYDSFTALYGTGFSDTDYVWPKEYDWYENGYGPGGNQNVTYYNPAGTANGTRLTFTDAFILTGNATSQNFYGRTPAGNVPIRFYKQNVDLNGYTEANLVNTTGGSFSIIDKYEGFRPVAYAKNGSANKTNLPTTPDSNGNYATGISNYSSLEIYFDRINYPLEFFPDQSTGAASVGKSVPYGKSLSEYAGQDPGVKPGHYFVGWYADDALTVPFDFTQTMPASGVSVFGYWRMERVRVIIVPGADNVYIDPSQAMSFRLDYNETISDAMLAEATRPGYALAGWADWVSDEDAYASPMMRSPASA